MRKGPLMFWGADWHRRLPYRRFLELKDRSRRLWAQTFSLVTLILGLTYLIWVGRLVLRNRQWQDFLFLAAESLSFLLLFLLAFDIWHLRYHRPEGCKPLKDQAVDIFVPCCGEPFKIIKTTLAAVRGISHSSMEVFVLDDAASPQVAALAQSLGFHYLSRPLAGLSLQDSKSGNLNFGLSCSQGEFILVLDADQVPDREILSRMLGFFRRPQVGFVQSKQAFFLPEGDPFYNGDKIFYETLQLSNDQANAVISCGSGVIYRRQALKALGGFATWNIVEDFTTSYELVSQGWKGIYFPYVLSRGLAPSTLAGVYRQRFQWCLDTMRLFFWDNPLLKSGLTWTQSIHFLIVMLSYLVSGLVFPVFYLIPLLVYWGGYSSLEGHETPYWILRGAYLSATVLMFHFLFFRKNALKQFKMLCSLFPVHIAAICAALIYPPGRKPRYRVNNLQPFVETGSWWHLAPLLGFIALHLTLPFISLWQGWALPGLIVFNAIFSAFIVWVLGDLVLAAVAKPKWSSARDPRQVYV
ncbi:MAG: cellulose synthase catalytic subunit [Desulfobaccales bacterium]|nr:cellulose synthase catalytic subunit [Desulfobaccales bacterium]